LTLVLSVHYKTAKTFMTPAEIETAIFQPVAQFYRPPQE
jgi:hypothetical protein